MNCVLCNRRMLTAAVLIGAYPVGPRCARKAGLMPLAAKRAGLVKPGPMYRSHATRQEIAQLELFEVAA